MRFARPIATLLLAVGVATCSDTPIAPLKTGATPNLKPGIGRLALVPAFSKTAQYVAQNAAAFPAVQFDSVHIVIRGTPDTTTIVKDTTIFFDPTSLSITLNLDVPVSSDGQRFNAAMAYKGPSGVVYSGSVVVQAHAPDQPAQPATIVVNYVGPGSKVKTISVSPKSITLLGTQATVLTVGAVDSSGAAATVPPLSWSTSDGSIVSVSATGAVTGLNKRGSATITASTPTGLSDNASVTVTLPPAGIAVVSGGGQSAKVGAPLPNPAVVQVSAVDGLGVAGVSVVFSAPAGGSVSPTTATTDGSGRASVSMKLGSAVGPQGFAATAAGFSTAISATATAGDPAAIAVVSGSGQSDTVGHALKAPLVVKVSDVGGNPVSGATVTWARTAGTGTVGSATTTTNTDGLASSTYTLGTTVGAEGVSASIAGQSATFSLTALAGGAAKIASVSGDGQTGRVGQPLDAPFVVAVADAAGNPVSGATVTWAATNGTIAATSTAGANGQASATMTGGQTLGPASATASVGGQSVTFTATLQAGAPAKLVFTASPTSGVPNQALTPVQVAVRDLGGNPTTATTAVTVALGANAAGATLSGTTTRVAVNGTATFDDLKLDKVGTGFTLTASGGALSGGVSAPFSTAIGTATQMAFVPGSSTTFTATAGHSVTLPQVKVSDASGNGIAGITLHAVLDSGTAPNVATITAGDAVSDASGLVSLAPPSTTVAGSYRITVTSPSISGAQLVVSGTIQPDVASALKFISPATAISAVTAGANLPVVVAVADQYGNVVTSSSATITTSLNVPNTVIGVTFAGNKTVAASAGVAGFTNLTIDRAATGYTLTAIATGLTSATSHTFDVAPAASNKLVFVPAPTSGTVGQTLSVNVQVQDTFGNVVTTSGTSITVAAASGPGSITGGGPVATSSGNAAFSLGFTTAGTYTLQATATSLTSATTGSVTIAASSVQAMAFSQSPSTTGNIGATLSTQPWIQLTDANGNSVSLNGVVITASIANAPSCGPACDVSGSLSLTGTTTATTDANGLAKFTNLGVLGIIRPGQLTFSKTSGTSQTLADLTSLITLSPGAASSITNNSSITVSVLQSATLGAGQHPSIKVRDISGNAIPSSSATITFSVTDGSCTLNGGSSYAPSVDGSGLSTLTSTQLSIPATAGSCAIRATSAPSLTGSPLTFNVIRAASVGITWLGSLTNDFSQTTNWIDNSTGLAPSSISTDIFVPEHSGNTPTLSANAQVGAIKIESGGAIALNTKSLTATGNVDAGSVSSGGISNGSLFLESTSASTSIQGALPTTTVGASSCGGGTFSLGGTTTTGSLTVQCPLTIGAQTLTTTSGGSFTTTGADGKLIMQTAGGLVDVAGSSTFSGADETGLLTNGTFEARGNFSQLSTVSAKSYAPSGSHLTSLWGGSNQSVSFADANNSFFNDVEVRNAGITATFTTAAQAIRDFSITSTSNNTQATFNQTFTVGRDFTANANTKVVQSGSGKRIIVGGTVTAASTSDLGSVDSLRVTGSTFPVYNNTTAGKAPKLTQLTGTVSLVNATQTVAGGLSIGTNLDLNGKTLVVKDSVIVNGNLKFQSATPTNVLTVGGLFRIDGGNVVMQSSAGRLDVGGDFNEAGSTTTAFQPASGFLTRFNGTSSQTITFSHASSSQSYFRDLTIANTSTGGVTFATNGFVLGTLLDSNNARLKTNSGISITASGTVSSTSGAKLSDVKELIVTSSDFPTFAGDSTPAKLTLTGSGTMTMNADATLTGALSVQRLVFVNGHKLILTAGDLAVEGTSGLLKVATNSDSIVVGGNATFSGADQDASGAPITAGAFDFKGNFTASGSNTFHNSGSGSNTTRFTGTGAQTITVTGNDNNFGNLVISNTSSSGVTLGSNTQILKNFDQNGVFKLTSAAGTVTVSGTSTFSAASTSTIDAYLILGQTTFVTGATLKGTGTVNSNGSCLDGALRSLFTGTFFCLP